MAAYLFHCLLSGMDARSETPLPPKECSDWVFGKAHREEQKQNKTTWKKAIPLKKIWKVSKRPDLHHRKSAKRMKAIYLLLEQRLSQLKRTNRISPIIAKKSPFADLVCALANIFAAFLRNFDCPTRMPTGNSTNRNDHWIYIAGTWSPFKKLRLDLDELEVMKMSWK